MATGPLASKLWENAAPEKLPHTLLDAKKFNRKYITDYHINSLVKHNKLRNNIYCNVTTDGR
ncbi:MAG: hypothetical protein J5I59_02870 [Saprospiraceae bacterium]|nr:hypothetical protein [Saprospiraceae bacterium]